MLQYTFAGEMKVYLNTHAYSALTLADEPVYSTFITDKQPFSATLVGRGRQMLSLSPQRHPRLIHAEERQKPLDGVVGIGEIGLAAKADRPRHKSSALQD